MRILQVADRLGWAIDRLSKPLAEKYDNIDIAYQHDSVDRYLNTGYSQKGSAIGVQNIDFDDYDIVHFHKPKAVNKFKSLIKGRKIGVYE